MSLKATEDHNFQLYPMTYYSRYTTYWVFLPMIIDHWMGYLYYHFCMGTWRPGTEPYHGPLLSKMVTSAVGIVSQWLMIVTR